MRSKLENLEAFRRDEAVLFLHPAEHSDNMALFRRAILGFFSKIFLSREKHLAANTAHTTETVEMMISFSSIMTSSEVLPASLCSIHCMSPNPSIISSITPGLGHPAANMETQPLACWYCVVSLYTIPVPLLPSLRFTQHILWILMRGPCRTDSLKKSIDATMRWGF